MTGPGQNGGYFKVLGPGGVARFGSGVWPLPNRSPGDWIFVGEGIDACRWGLHLCRARDLPVWVGPEIYTAEWSGVALEFPDEVVTSRARLLCRFESWTERTARLFAADCAEHALDAFDGRMPSFRRPRWAIDAARAFAKDEIGLDELTLARDASNKAAKNSHSLAMWYAASSATWAAARSALAGGARNAARSAASAVGEKRNGSDAREWQTTRLFEYLGGQIDGDYPRAQLADRRADVAQYGDRESR